MGLAEAIAGALLTAGVEEGILVPARIKKAAEEAYVQGSADVKAQLQPVISKLERANTDLRNENNQLIHSNNDKDQQLAKLRVENQQLKQQLQQQTAEAVKAHQKED